MIKVKIIFASLMVLFGFYANAAVAATQHNKNVFAPVYHASYSPASKNAFVVPQEHLHKTANLSYKVAGKQYFPLQKIADFTEVGRASYYGGQFHGRRTSSGEIFNQNSLTAAHPTLPIPSYARVTNLNNGKSVVVRINDRGPFHASRVIDVSRAAAQQLDFLRAGTTNVRVEQILPGKPLQPETTYVDLQRFKDKQAAQNYLTSISRHLQQAHSNQTVSLVKVNRDYVVRMQSTLPAQNETGVVKKNMLTTSL